MIYEILSWLLIALAFGYTVLRACYLGITHDEAVTYLYWSAGSFRDIFLFNGFAPPNNHLLNSLLIKLSVSCFGLSEFAIRIPALIGHALYLTGVYKTLKLLFKENLLAAALCILIFNPFILQIFAIGRGYALGLGFMSMGIYFILRFLRQKKDLYIFWGFLMLSFATISCFTFFHVYLAALVWIMGYEIMMKHASGKMVLPSLLILIGTCLFPILKIQAFHYFIAELGHEGFWKNTVLILIDVTLYNQAYLGGWFSQLIQYFIIAVIMMAAVLGLMSLRCKEDVFHQPTFSLLRCVAVILLLCCAFIVVEGAVIKFGYPEGRAAIYLIPLFNLFLLLLIEWGMRAVKGSSRVRTAASCFVVALAFISLIHFVRTANLRDFYRIGAYEESSREAIDYLIELHKSEQLKDRSISIATHRNFTPLLDFYIIKKNVKWLKILPYQEDLRCKFDYYYLSGNNDGFLEKSEMDAEQKTAFIGKHLEIFKVFQDGAYLAR